MFPHIGRHGAAQYCLAPEDPQLLAQLQQRIAVLEIELRHTQGQRDDAQKANLYLLETLASKSPHCEDTDTLKRQIRAADRSNAALKVRLASAKQDNLRAKSKMRLALGDITARSRKMFHLELALARTQQWRGQLGTLPQTTHSANIPDLLGFNGGETQELLSTPTWPLSPFDSSSGDSYDESLTSLSTPLHTLPHKHSGKASGSGVGTLTPSTAGEASPHRDAQPRFESPYKYVSYFEASSKDLEHNGTCEDVGKAGAANDDCGDRVFESRGELNRAAHINEITAGFEDLQYSDIFVFGLMYQPSPLEKDVYRTVIVANVPIETTLQDVMEKVRGGLIVSTQLLDTVKITGTQTVMMIFFSETSASAYAKFAAAHPVVFGGRIAQVTHLQNQTWPMEARLHAAILKGNNTRCLSIQNLPADMEPADLVASLQPLHNLKTDYVESLRSDRSGLLHVTFESVKVAGMARSKLMDLVRFRDCIVRFEPDPCQQPLETLLERGLKSPNDRDMGFHPPAMFSFEYRSGEDTSSAICD